MQKNFPGSRHKFPGKREVSKPQIFWEISCSDFPGRNTTVQLIFSREEDFKWNERFRYCCNHKPLWKFFVVWEVLLWIRVSYEVLIEKRKIINPSISSVFKTSLSVRKVWGWNSGSVKSNLELPTLSTTAAFLWRWVDQVLILSDGSTACNTLRRNTASITNILKTCCDGRK